MPASQPPAAPDPPAAPKQLAETDWGLLLLNLGTPDSPQPADVRRYLREFLSDPRVLDINPAFRKVLLETVILPRRPKESGEAYASIWTERGSPLLFHSQDFAAKVARKLEGLVHIELGMRYQNPSVASALAAFRQRGIDKIIVFPLFPQYSASAWGSGVEKVFEEARKHWNVPSIQVVPPFFDHPAYIDSFVEVARPVLEEAEPEQVLFSFHGLPERHVTKSDESPAGKSHCLASEDCCAAICPANRNCYRAQCYESARRMVAGLRAAGLAMEDGTWEVTFQSRLGRDPWIRPWTDVRIEELAKSGTKRIALLSPAFVADCLETLEELGIRAAEDFRAAGGETSVLVPCPNSEDHWVDGAIRIVEESTALGSLLRAGAR